MDPLKTLQPSYTHILDVLVVGDGGAHVGAEAVAEDDEQEGEGVDAVEGGEVELSNPLVPPEQAAEPPVGREALRVVGCREFWN